MKKAILALILILPSLASAKDYDFGMAATNDYVKVKQAYKQKVTDEFSFKVGLDVTGKVKKGLIEPAYNVSTEYRFTDRVFFEVNYHRVDRFENLAAFSIKYLF